jgi:hypothetical protein
VPTQASAVHAPDGKRHLIRKRAGIAGPFRVCIVSCLQGCLQLACRR